MVEASDDSGVRTALEEMLAAGASPAPPVTPALLRIRADHRHRRRLDPKLVVTVAAAVALIVVLFAVQPLRHRGEPVDAGRGTVPHGWVAHSAFGLQIAAPTTWRVEVFGQCPDGRKPGSLFIGTTRFIVNCPEYGADATSVTLFDTTAPGASVDSTTAARTIEVHGLTVRSSTLDGRTQWVIPARHVAVTGSGPHALAVMGTLAPASRQAVPATGTVSGTVTLKTLSATPANGQASARNTSTGTTVRVLILDGQYSFSGPPARYVVTVHDGNAPCDSTSVVLRSGEIVTATPLTCQGD
jgi:hypothetical protein